MASSAMGAHGRVAQFYGLDWVGQEAFPGW